MLRWRSGGTRSWQVVQQRWPMAAGAGSPAGRRSSSLSWRRSRPRSVRRTLNSGCGGKKGRSTRLRGPRADPQRGSAPGPAVLRPAWHPERAQGMTSANTVFVRDAVLGRYEGDDEFRINPEYGSVAHGNQWGISWTERVGRDLIELELKKIYEGARPEEVRHWHGFAVPGPPVASLAETNVGLRAKRITYALADLGAALAASASLNS